MLWRFVTLQNVFLSVCARSDPGFMREVQVDKGAIRFILGGAHIMCPGLTSKGGDMEEDLPAEQPVVRRGGRKKLSGSNGQV